MSHRRNSSVRDKVIGKKWIYSERDTLHSQGVGHHGGQIPWPPSVVRLAFKGLMGAQVVKNLPAIQET